jgi:hypothetical protein
MEEGSPYYGQKFYYGETLLDGTINDIGTNEEYEAALGQQMVDKFVEDGASVYTDEDGYTVIHFDD